VISSNLYCSTVIKFIIDGRFSLSCLERLMAGDMCPLTEKVMNIFRLFRLDKLNKIALTNWSVTYLKAINQQRGNHPWPISR
jgi:hypothetical protein